MTSIFHALWMLCALGAAVFAAEKGVVPLFRGWPTGKRGTTPFSLAVGFLPAALYVRPDRLPDVGWTGGVVALTAALALIRPRYGALTAACGGMLAAFWAALLEFEGLPRPAALGVATTLPAISSYLAARHPAFAPRVLREEALLAVFALAVVVAMAPTVSEGWRAALALNLVDQGGSTHIVPAWTIGLAAGSVALGGLYSLWRRG